MTKEEKYIDLLPKAAALIDASSDLIADMANISSLLQSEFGFWWTGFYRVQDGKLILGPFQGPVACTGIPFGKGVCGTAWKERKTIVVPDVEKFPGHIACSSESRSEIVVPVWHYGEIIAVLDIDSRELATFDEIDRHWLELLCAELSCRVKPDLREYVEREIIPQYRNFDAAHREDHARYVIGQALLLSCRYPVDPNISYTAAAVHDIGLAEGRERHNFVSARMTRGNKNLLKWFSEEEVNIIADAAEDHRASLGHEPRTIYGKIVSEADRQIIPEVVIRRTVQYGLKHYPEMDKEGHWHRMLDHMAEKYAEGGYIRLWIPESDNAERLEELRGILKDEQKLRSIFEAEYERSLAPKSC